MEFQMKEIGYKTTFEYGELHVAGDVTYGFRPFQLMVSAIAGCSGSVFRKILDKKESFMTILRFKLKLNGTKKKRTELKNSSSFHHFKFQRGFGP